MLRTVGLREPMRFQQFLVSSLVPVLIVIAFAADAANVSSGPVHEHVQSFVYAPDIVAVLKRKVLSCTGFLLSRKYVGLGCHCIADIDSPGRPRLNGVKLNEYDFVAGVTSAMLFSPAKFVRKPKALLTHPWCENYPPRMYDIGIAVMEEPFPTIRDVIEVYDMLSTSPVDFDQILTLLLAWDHPDGAPNCTFSGWKTSSNPDENRLITVNMVHYPPTECVKLWRQEDPALIPKQFDFSFPNQFCLVTQFEADDNVTLPDDGPLVCDRLYVGFVSFGPERRKKTRQLPIVAGSLVIILDWIAYDSYFDRIGCFGTNADCLIDYALDDLAAATKTRPLGILMLLLCFLK